MQLIERNQPLIVGGDQMSQHFCFGSSCEPDSIGEPRTIVNESFGDVPRTRTHGVAQLSGALVVPLEVRRQQEQVDSQVEQMRESPGADFGEVVEGKHDGAPVQPVCRAASHEIRRDREAALARRRRNRNVCRAGPPQKLRYRLPGVGDRGPRGLQLLQRILADIVDDLRIGTRDLLQSDGRHPLGGVLFSVLHLGR